VGLGLLLGGLLSQSLPAFCRRQVPLDLEDRRLDLEGFELGLLPLLVGAGLMMGGTGSGRVIKGGSYSHSAC
jgi:hypothetical protein